MTTRHGGAAPQTQTHAHAMTAFLRTIDYPATTEDIVRAANQDGLSDEARDRISRLPNRSFTSAYYVAQTLDAATSSDAHDRPSAAIRAATSRESR